MSETTKILLLNPPNENRIQRRYMCSYNAPNMLFPPIELMALGGIARNERKCEVELIDAIAENINSAQLIEKLNLIKPDVIVSIQGFECFESDINELAIIKKHFPKTKMILFGHYATLFYEEILKKAEIDIIIHGEPDLIFQDVLNSLITDNLLENVSGISYKSGNEIITQIGDLRVKKSEDLPMPAYDLIKESLYFEPFMKPPFGLIQSARGCPYSCNYCVRSFGKKLTYRSADQVVDEIKYLKEKFGINSLRFIDDTFTVHAKRVIDICSKMIEQSLDIQWTCLSRLDSIKEETIPIMKKSGCKRIYFGVESGSPKVLKFLNKEMNLTEAKRIIKLCAKHGIETLGFFIVGTPNEDEIAFNESVKFAIDAEFDFIIVSELIPYPGTELFSALKEDIEFSILPYKNEWRDKTRSESNRRREKLFYNKFYFRPRYFIKSFYRGLSHPFEFFQNTLNLFTFLIKNSRRHRSDFI